MLFSAQYCEYYPDLQKLKSEVQECRACSLCTGRKQAVFGVGPTDRPILAIVGEAPGAREDEQGVPFVGRSGRLLDRMLEAIELSRDAVYITNCVACRPPDNRAPTTEELRECSRYLRFQLQAVRPRCIVALGSSAARCLTSQRKGISELLGRWYSWSELNVPVRAIYHPAYLLRDPSKKDVAWRDMMAVKMRIENERAA